jgi:hypothetical protein
MSGTVGANVAPPQNIFSVGKDLQAVLSGPTGSVQLPKLTGFSHKPQYDTIKSKPLDGPTIQVDLPDGHTFELDFDRKDSGVDTFFTATEAAYWAAGGFVPTFNLTFFVTERATGSSSIWQLAEVTLKYDPGSWKTGAAVAGKIMGYARYWRRLG